MILDENQPSLEVKPLIEAESSVVESVPVKYPRGKNPNSQRNLKPRVKGCEGLPNAGRPATRELGKFIREFLASPANNGDRSNLEEIVHRLKKEEPKVLLYYAFGKPVETVEMTGANGSNLIPDNLIQAAIQIVQAKQ